MKGGIVRLVNLSGQKVSLLTVSVLIVADRLKNLKKKRISLK